MLSVDLGTLAANTLRPEITLLSWQWGNKPITPQKALVLFHFVLEDSLAACPTSQGCNGPAHAPEGVHPTLLIKAVS